MTESEELSEYRGQAWQMAAMIPGMSVRVNAYGVFPDLTVTYRLGSKHTFHVERVEPGKVKVTNREITQHNKRKVKLENLMATIVTWATSRDAAQAQRDAHRCRIILHKGLSEGGRYEFSIEDDGEVRFELHAMLPKTLEAKLQIDPTLLLIETIAVAVAEAFTSYVTRAKRAETEAKSGKVVSING